MQGYLSLILHAHLPFVRHPEHERFLEENWLYEAVVETYLPLLQLMEGWLRDGLDTRVTLTLSPTLCSMLQDPLLQERCERHLNDLVELAEKEVHRTTLHAELHALAVMYFQRFSVLRQRYLGYRRDLVDAFRKFQEAAKLEIIPTAATHAVLPLLANDLSSVRGQILVARDHYYRGFGREPRGLWLPECAYVEALEAVLQEAGIRWFVVETHGILQAQPRPQYGIFAPLYTPNGLAAFGRDLDSAKQVWSKDEGYPGDPRYRDFYRDIGFDLEYEYVRPLLPAEGTRTFTGIKYHAITGRNVEKKVYNRQQALSAAEEHAAHFLDARMRQVQQLAGLMERPPIIVCPYDAELFGHWWYEGPEFLDQFVRKIFAGQQTIALTTPREYLHHQPAQQVARPSASSWGEDGYWKVWLNETNQWIYPHLQVAQERMAHLARKYPQAEGLVLRALQQAARELLLAQASDWPFILRTGTSPGYARQRVTEHISRFTMLHDQLVSGTVAEASLAAIEHQDNLFPDVDYRYWG